MKKGLLVALGALFGTWSCQTESLDIQRSFPFAMRMDAFPVALTRNRPSAVGFGIVTDYLTSGNAFTFSWQVVPPQRGVLVLNKQVVEPGKKVVVFATMSRLLSDTLTYVPTDSGAHELTIRVPDAMGQRKDTIFTLTAVKWDGSHKTFPTAVRRSTSRLTR